MKSGKQRIITGFVMSTLLATVLACGSTPVPPTAIATAILPPTQTSLPTQTPSPLYLSVSLTSTSRNETSAAPAPVYTLRHKFPFCRAAAMRA